jgi:hypothetical protein
LLGFLGPIAPPQSAIDMEAARASLRSDLRHHDKREIVTALFPPAGQWASKAYAAFGALERDERDADAWATLDRVHVEIDEDARRHGDRIGYFIGALRRAQIEILDLIKQRDNEAEKGRCLRRAAIAGLAVSTRRDFSPPAKMPKALTPWRVLHSEKRQRVRQRRDDFLTLLASPLFDAEHYMRAYPDVAAGETSPALHYLLHGSDEGRSPSSVVDPKEVVRLFPELAGRKGNLVLNLIALHAPKSES